MCLIYNYTILNCVDLKIPMNFKFIFTWWHKQTFGTFIKTLLQEPLLEKINTVINTMRTKKSEVGDLLWRRGGNKNHHRLVFMDAPYY